MFVDFVLLAVVTLLTVGLTVIGGVVTSNELPVQLAFLIGGPILVVLLIFQGIRQIDAQQNSDFAFIQSRNDIRNERARYDAKVDELYALLQPRVGQGNTNVPAKPSKPTVVPPVVPASPPQAKPITPNSGILTVSQSPKTSTRADAPFETEIVVQTTASFPELKFAMQCDKSLVDGTATVGSGVQMMVSFGVLKDRPNVFVYSYGSSIPPFDPAHPLVIDVRSKEAVNCSQVSTF